MASGRTATKTYFLGWLPLDDDTMSGKIITLELEDLLFVDQSFCRERMKSDKSKSGKLHLSFPHC